MAAVKGRLNSLGDRKADDPKMSKPGELKNFKIYVEVDKVKNADSVNNRTKRQAATCKSGGYLLKNGGVKNLEKGKSKPYTSGSSQHGRKVLADIGNGNCSFSKTEQRKTCIPGKGKTVTILIISTEEGQT